MMNSEVFEDRPPSGQELGAGPCIEFLHASTSLVGHTLQDATNSGELPSPFRQMTGDKENMVSNSSNSSNSTNLSRSSSSASASNTHNAGEYLSPFLSKQTGTSKACRKLYSGVFPHLIGNEGETPSVIPPEFLSRPTSRRALGGGPAGIESTSVTGLGVGSGSSSSSTTFENVTIMGPAPSPCGPGMTSPLSTFSGSGKPRRRIFFQSAGPPSASSVVMVPSEPSPQELFARSRSPAASEVSGGLIPSSLVQSSTFSYDPGQALTKRMGNENNNDKNSSLDAHSAVALPSTEIAMHCYDLSLDSVTELPLLPTPNFLNAKDGLMTSGGSEGASLITPEPNWIPTPATGNNLFLSRMENCGSTPHTYISESKQLDGNNDDTTELNQYRSQFWTKRIKRESNPQFSGFAAHTPISGRDLSSADAKKASEEKDNRHYPVRLFEGPLRSPNAPRKMSFQANIWGKQPSPDENQLNDKESMQNAELCKQSDEALKLDDDCPLFSRNALPSSRGFRSRSNSIEHQALESGLTQNEIHAKQTGMNLQSSDFGSRVYESNQEEAKSLHLSLSVIPPEETKIITEEQDILDHSLGNSSSSSSSIDAEHNFNSIKVPTNSSSLSSNFTVDQQFPLLKVDGTSSNTSSFTRNASPWIQNIAPENTQSFKSDNAMSHLLDAGQTGRNHEQGYVDYPVVSHEVCDPYQVAHSFANEQAGTCDPNGISINHSQGHINEAGGEISSHLQSKYESNIEQNGFINRPPEYFPEPNTSSFPYPNQYNSRFPLPMGDSSSSNGGIVPFGVHPVNHVHMSGQYSREPSNFTLSAPRSLQDYSSMEAQIPMCSRSSLASSGFTSFAPTQGMKGGAHVGYDGDEEEGEDDEDEEDDDEGGEDDDNDDEGEEGAEEESSPSAAATAATAAAAVAAAVAAGAETTEGEDSGESRYNLKRNARRRQRQRSNRGDAEEMTYSTYYNQDATNNHVNGFRRINVVQNTAAPYVDSSMDQFSSQHLQNAANIAAAAAAVAIRGDDVQNGNINIPQYGDHPNFDTDSRRSGSYYAYDNYEHNGDYIQSGQQHMAPHPPVSSHFSHSYSHSHPHPAMNLQPLRQVHYLNTDNGVGQTECDSQFGNYRDGIVSGGDHIIEGDGVEHNYENIDAEDMSGRYNSYVQTRGRSRTRGSSVSTRRSSLVANTYFNDASLGSEDMNRLQSSHLMSADDMGSGTASGLMRSTRLNGEQSRSSERLRNTIAAAAAAAAAAAVPPSKTHSNTLHETVNHQGMNYNPNLNHHSHHQQQHHHAQHHHYHPHHHMNHLHNTGMTANTTATSGATNTRGLERKSSVSMLTSENSRSSGSHSQSQAQNQSQSQSQAQSLSQSQSQPVLDGDEYLCLTCSRRFKKLAALRRHERIHVQGRPYACTWPHCNRRFSERANLKRHIKIHLGQRDFVCKIPGCNQKFGRKSHLVHHLSGAKHAKVSLEWYLDEDTLRAVEECRLRRTTQPRRRSIPGPSTSSTSTSASAAGASGSGSGSGSSSNSHGHSHQQHQQHHNQHYR